MALSNVARIASSITQINRLDLALSREAENGMFEKGYPSNFNSHASNVSLRVRL